MMHYQQNIIDSLGHKVADTILEEHMIKKTLEGDKFPCYESFKKLDLLPLTPFGRMKLSVIPEGVVTTIYNYFKNEQKVPKFETFFQVCIQHCKSMDIDLSKRFGRFYEVCRQRGYDPNKIPVCTQKSTVVQTRDIEAYSEDDFWKVELDVLNQPEKWETVGYTPNPWARIMRTLEVYKYPLLYGYYLDAHPYGRPDPEKLIIYHQHLASLQTSS